MGRKRKTRWRRLSIGETSANEDEDGELGGAVISLTRSHSHSASQNHSPARHHSSDKSLITMTNNNKDSSSSPSLQNSSSNLTTPNGASGTNNGSGGPNSGSSSTAKILPGTASSSSPINPDKSGIPPQNSSPSSASSPNHHPHHHSQSSGYHHNGHNHVPHEYNNSNHPSPNSVSSNESTSSSTGGGGGGNGSGGHYNDRYHYTRENYRPPHHSHHHHHSHHNSNYNGGSSSHYQGASREAGGPSTSRGERSYHYSGHPHKEYQNGYHGPGHYSGYQGSSYYRNSHNNYRNFHYNSGGGGSGGGGTGSGGEPYGDSEGYPSSSRPYGGRFRKSRSYPASSYYYPGSSKSSGGAGNNTDNINRPSYNQDEYTKITTPRQDVLFKKGYLSQKKTQPSSVDSTSAATTPSASTNGTPDTQSTNGINSDNSEGYENGETDYVIPYDDTIYYAPPPEAVFTDPNTGQVYYDNSEGYENGETDYVIPYDDTIYYAPPPEAVFTDPNTGQVYYGHCSSTGEYYDAYPVSPVMVATGYPPVYYPMMPYAPIDGMWNGVPAPMYPVVAAPVPPHPLPAVDDPSLLSPGLQGLESSPATTNPNSNSDTTTTNSCTSTTSASAASAAGGGGVNATCTTTSNTFPADPTSPSPQKTVELATKHTKIRLSNEENEREEGDDVNKECLDSGIDSGSSVGDPLGSAATSQGNSSGAEEECGSNKAAMMMMMDDHTNTVVRKKQAKQANNTINNNNNNEMTAKAGKTTDNNSSTGESKLVEGVKKLHLSKEKKEYSSSESVLSSTSSSLHVHQGENISPKGKVVLVENGDDGAQQQDTGANKSPNMTSALDTATMTTIPPHGAMPVNIGTGMVKGITAMVISSQHPQHLTTTYNATGQPHPQAIGGPVMTTVPLPVGCPSVMLAAAPSGMPISYTAAPMHPMAHPPGPPPQQDFRRNSGPPQQPPPQAPHHSHHGGRGHPQHHHNSHHSHNVHNHSHPPPGPPPRHQGPPPNHHYSSYSHFHHQSGPSPHQQQQQHQNSPHHHHQPHHHHMPPPPHPPGAPSQAPPPPPQVAMGAAGPPPPPGTAPYHMYPHPTTYVYGPPVYNDEGSSSSVITTTTAVESCANLTTTASEHEQNALQTATNITTKAADFTESAVVINENKLKGGTMREESSELTRTIEDGKEKTKEKVEQMGESYYTERNTTKTKTKTERVETTTSTTPVTSSEAATKQNCDSKVENIIASKEFSIFYKTVTSAEAAVTSVPISYSVQKKGNENEAITAASSSLTLESSDKMNEEIEIRPLKQEMSKTEGVAQKVCGIVGDTCFESKSLSASFQEEKKCEHGPEHEKHEEEKSDKVTTTTTCRITCKSHENDDDNPAETTSVEFLPKSSTFSATFPASPGSSSPSSTNESSTSSPVNEGTSLMRSQSKLACRKNLAREDESDNGMMTAVRLENAVGESCKGKKNSSKDNSKKKNKRKQSPPLNPKMGNAAGGGGNKKNNRMRERKDDDSINLLENEEQNRITKNKKGQMDNGEEKNNKTDCVPNSDETRGQQEGQNESGNQMVSSTDSGQPISQETCSSSIPSPQEGVAETGDSLSDSCSVGLMTTEPKASITSSSSSSRKPTDLTVQCPAATGNDDQGQYEALQLQRSPSLHNEPSSPDSLNTNQSVAGSEFAPGENLSVSESDLMNRTTSIDEVEEDLPQEAEFIVGTETSVGFTVPNSISSNDNSENLASKSLSAEEKFETSRESAEITTAEASGPDEESIKSATILRATVATPSSSSVLLEKSRSNEEQEVDGMETTVRPQSITLAVTEWLKTQGEGALTPVITRAFSSDEADVEEESTTDSGEDSVDGEEDGEKASNLKQNQKNVYGNPWAVAPSNKSGSSTKVSKSNGTTRCRRSGSKKSIMVKVENEGNWSANTGLPKSDGVCSRVAPLLSSKASSSILLHDETGSANRNSNNSSTSDDDASFSPAHTAAKNIIAKNNELLENANDKHKASFTKSPNFPQLSNDYLKNSRDYNNDSSSKADDDSYTVSIVETGKDYDSGLELSSTENSSSMSSIICTPMSANSMNGCMSTESNGKSINATSAASVMNAKKKSKDLANYHSSCVTTTATIDTAPTTDIATAALVNETQSKKSNDRPPLPKLITNNNQSTTTHHYHAPHSRCFNPNPDQIVIAAPLSIVQQDSAISSTQKTGNNSDNDDEAKGGHQLSSRKARKNSAERVSTAPTPQAYNSATVPSSSSSCNNTAPTSPLGMTGSSGSGGIMLFSRSGSSSVNNNDVQSPSSMPSSLTSIVDEQRDHTEICDPQRYAKYYQFGVVFDTSDDPDQGIDTAADEGDSTDSLEDMDLDSPEAAIVPCTAAAAAHSLENIGNNKNNDNDNIAQQKRLQKSDEPQQKRSAGETEHQEQQKNTNDFLAVMMERNRKLARSGKKNGMEKKKKRVDKERNNGDELLQNEWISTSAFLNDTGVPFLLE